MEANWEGIRRIRQELGLLLEGYSPELRAATMMAATELLENAVKYGDAVAQSPQVEFELSLDPGVIQLKATNGCTAAEKVERLRSILDDLVAASDPEVLYLERIRQRSASVSGVPDSGLGLYRIAVEGGFDLAVTYTVGVVSVLASRSTR